MPDIARAPVNARKYDSIYIRSYIPRDIHFVSQIAQLFMKRAFRGAYRFFSSRREVYAYFGAPLSSDAATSDVKN